MPKSQMAIGVDIGAHALRAVVLRKRGSHIAVLRAGSVELGDLAFIDDSERRDRRVADLLRLLLRQTRIRRQNVGVGLAGRDYFVKYLHVPPAPPQKLRKLIEYEVQEDATAGTHERTTDFWLLDLPTKGEDFTVLIAMARNETLRRRLALLKGAGLFTEGVTLNATALFNTYVQTKDEGIYNEKTTLLVDIGARHMDVVVQRNAKLLFIRNLSLGGLRFSESVQEDFHLPIHEAEELKLAQGAILPRHFDVAAEIDTGTPEARLSAALLEPAEQIYDTLQATIKYCQAQTRLRELRIDEVVLSGRACRLKGLRDFLARRFGLPVEILDPFQGIDTTSLPPRWRDEVLAEGPGYAVATGLALRQFADPHHRILALLPEEVRRRREFLAHDAFLYVAAAVFVLAFGAMVYSSKAATQRKEEQIDFLQKQVKSAGSVVGDFEARMQENQILANQAQALKRLLDTGRRSNHALAILTEKIPPQLRIDAINTVTERPVVSLRTREEGKLTTTLLIEGRVAEQYGGKEITEALALDIVNSFLDSLASQRGLYSGAKVLSFPKYGEAQRTFKIIVTFAAPFYGGENKGVRR